MNSGIITLCGSTRFRDQFREVEKKLTMEGSIPLPLSFFEKAEGVEYSADMKRHLWNLQKRKIDISESIYVIDPEGYIGESTQKEIEYARSVGKSVRFYSKEIGTNENS